MVELKTKLLSVLNPDTGVYKSIDALKGDDGYTPQRGIDYWTPADKEEKLAFRQGDWQSFKGFTDTLNHVRDFQS